MAVLPTWHISYGETTDSISTFIFYMHQPGRWQHAISLSWCHDAACYALGSIIYIACKENDNGHVLCSLMQLLVPLKPRSWHIARPVYITNSTECDVVIFGGNVHIEGHLGDRDNTADLRILSCGTSCHILCGRSQCCRSMMKNYVADDHVL